MLGLLMALLTSSCSTTKKLGSNDVLYTGVKHLKYHEDSVKVDEGVKTDIFTAINVKPNNPLYSPYYRTPFPFGLMLYNSIDEDDTRFKGWLYKHFAAKPVLISRVNPQARVDMINTILHNNGYFTSSARIPRRRRFPTISTSIRHIPSAILSISVQLTRSCNSWTRWHEKTVI